LLIFALPSIPGNVRRIIALAAIGVGLVALGVAPRAALASRECLSTGCRRGRRVGNGRQIVSPESRREQQ
jgi:hypothetical protein